jgi:cytochrome bd-type quinol oxidase subunit 2
MPIEVYRVLHLFGIFGLMCSLAGLAMVAWQTRGAQAVKDEVNGARKRLTILHGIAMLVVLVAGFGMMAKLGLMSVWPIWVILKIVIWLVFGAAPALIRKGAESGRAWLIVLPLLGAVSAYLAIFHPV